MRRTALIVLGIAFLGSVGYSQMSTPREGFRYAMPVETVMPVYPTAAIADRIQGEVWVEFAVGTDGIPSEINVVKPLDGNKYGIDAAAVTAMRRWRFKPATQDGQPVPVRISHRFDIRPQAQTPQPAVDQNNERMQRLQREAALKAAESVQQMQRLVALRRVMDENAPLKADQIFLGPGPARLQGNVTLSFANGIVITADEVIVEDGEIRLGENARVRFPQK